MGSGSHCGVLAGEEDQTGTIEEKPEQPRPSRNNLGPKSKRYFATLRQSISNSRQRPTTLTVAWKPPETFLSLQLPWRPPGNLRTSLLEGSGIPLEASEPLAAGEPVGAGRGVVAAGRFPPGLSSLCNGLVLQRSYDGPSTNEALRARTEPTSTPLKSPGPPTLN